MRIEKKMLIPTIVFWILGLIWGSNFLYMKLAVQYITPMQVVLFRVLLSVLPVVLYATFTHAFKKEHLKHWHHFFIMSLLATVVYYYLYVKGSHLLHSGIAGAISGSTPVFSFILGLLLLNEEKMTYQKISGCLLGVIGILILAKLFDTAFAPATWEGIAYMIIGSISFGASFIYAKIYISPLQISSAALTSYQLIGASLILLVCSDFDGVLNIFNDSRAALGLVVGLGILGTGVAYLIYYYIIEKMGAIKASSVTYIPPIVALFIGSIIAKEPIQLTDFVGALIILLGVYFLKK